MKKVEFETRLTQSPHFADLMGGAALTEGQNADLNGAGSSGPLTQVRRAPPQRGTAGPKGPIGLSIDINSYSMAGLHHPIAVDTALSPEQSLEAAAKAYRESPSKRTAIQLEMAINRIGVTWRNDDTAGALMDKAVDALSEKVEKDVSQGYVSDNVYARLYQHSDFRGGQIFTNLSLDAFLSGWSNLSSSGFNDRISSLTLSASPDEIGGRLILFQNDRFRGRYSRYEVAGGEENRVAYIGGYLNDRTTALFVQRFYPDERQVNLGWLISAQSISEVVDETPKIYNRGDRILAWDLYPDGRDGHPNESSRAYIYLRIPIYVEVNNWFDYEAEIRYWINMYVDGSGTLHADLEYYGAWVEGGIISGSVMDGLMADTGIPASLDRVRNSFSMLAAFFNVGGPYRSVHLLPGRYDPEGHTDDDVTIVLVPGIPDPPGPIL
jgi:hypothetical protein